MSYAKCRTKDNDSFKVHELNKMKTFYINMQIPHRKLSILFRFTRRRKKVKSIQIVHSTSRTRRLQIADAPHLSSAGSLQLVTHHWMAPSI